MYTKYYKDYSPTLQREMEFKVYGHAGKPCLVFSAQNGNFYDFENFGMVNCISNYIEEGRVQLFCVQSIDEETWSGSWDYRTRIEQHERWTSYICDELLPRLHSIHNNTCQKDDDSKFLCIGVSMGAYHALNHMLRRPELFDSCIGLSGVYHASFFFPNYNDELIYLNSPVDVLNNIDYHHPYVEKYRNNKIILCCGQGNWENESMEDTSALKNAMKRLDIPAWVDFWGKDVAHDWPWWQKQLPYFLKGMLEEFEHDN